MASAKACYTKLERVDLNGTLPLDDQTIEAIVCVGVLTYIAQDKLFREWARILRPGGVAVFTCRDDCWRDRGFDVSLEALDDTFTVKHKTDALPYLPGHPEFGTNVQVRYGVIAKK